MDKQDSMNKDSINNIGSPTYKEVTIGNTLYRVTSIFTGEKDLGKSLEQLALRRALLEAAHDPEDKETA